MITRREFLGRSGMLVAWAGLDPRFPERAFSQPLDQWNESFARPPASAYPWVFAFWMNGNLTRQGITADLEGMRRGGIRGITLFPCISLRQYGIGSPPGPVECLSDVWFGMFEHLLKEGDRLGIEVCVNDSPDWDGSGGKWITPEMASQQVVASETVLTGASHYEGALPMPSLIRKGYYREIALLAYPLASGVAPTYRIPNFNSSKSFAGGEDFGNIVPWPRFIPTNPAWPVVPEDQTLDKSRMVDLTDKLKSDGTLTWEVPPGHWLVLRFGHTVANGASRVAEPQVAGLECDKMRKAAIELEFNSMIGRLIEHAGPLAGKVFTGVHVDSWECGSGNWTPLFRSEFQARRGYDLLPYLPTLNGLVIGSREISERFLWDLRETIHDLVVENYADHLRHLAHAKGLNLSIEAYDGTFDDLRFADTADLPMTEFWTLYYNGLPACDLTEEMASAAHVYGKRVLSAETFTSFRGDFLAHPATLKPLSDWAFCTGVNHLQLSEWVMQPWPNVVPGVSFGVFGTVFHETLTWWPLARPWNDYNARCQWMLQQGTFVADVCFVAPEGAPERYTPPIARDIRGVIPDRPKYNFDGCPGKLVIERMTTEDHRVSLPSGMKYALLVLPTYNVEGREAISLLTSDWYYKPKALPKIQTMTPELLRKVAELLRQGATVLGYRPLQSPSLRNFSACDEELTRIADELWGAGQGAAGKGRRRVGQGELFWGWLPEEILRERQILPDFQPSKNLEGILNYTHRRLDDGSDIYFVVNQKDGWVEGAGEFRASGSPELYWPETGKVTAAASFETSGGVTRIPLSLSAYESVFVVFRPAVQPASPIVTITRNGKQLPPPASVEPGNTDGSFEIAAWMTPFRRLTLPEPCAGGWAYKGAAPPTPTLSDSVVSSPGRNTGGFAVGTNGIIVFQYGESGDVEPLLVYEKEIKTQVLIGVIYREKIPRLYLNGRLVQTGPPSRFRAPAGGGWVDRRQFAARVAEFEQFEAMLEDAGAEGRNAKPKDAERSAVDLLHRKIWRSGDYVFKTADGKKHRRSVRLPAVHEIGGPWSVEFDPRWGGPGQVTFEDLADWSKHENDGIRYYSGAATYRRQFSWREKLPPAAGVALDLGKVASLASVTLNGKDLGTVWKPPYQVEVTEALRDGENTLEIRAVNMWVNRLIGDEHLPEDCERNSQGEVVAWPQWILDGKRSPTGRYTFSSIHFWSKDDPLLRSGLLGPVCFRCFEEI